MCTTKRRLNPTWSNGMQTDKLKNCISLVIYVSSFCVCEDHFLARAAFSFMLWTSGWCYWILSTTHHTLNLRTSPHWLPCFCTLSTDFCRYFLLLFFSVCARFSSNWRFNTIFIVILVERLLELVPIVGYSSYLLLRRSQMAHRWHAGASPRVTICVANKS